MEHFLIM